MTVVCTQKSSHGCDKKAVVTAACNALRSTGMIVPQGCPADATEVKKNILNVVIFVVTIPLGQINVGHLWLQSSHKLKLSGDSSLLSINSIR